MPLLNKQPFVRTKAPDGLSPSHELFFCQSTHEVFEDYEAFFQRIILCNSLVWTCEITGRPGLTFDEATDSEKRAKKVLAEFPYALKKPLLYLTTLTCRGRLADLCDDIFVFAKDRYFEGETVDHVSKGGQKKQCVILRVLDENCKSNNHYESDSAESSLSDDPQSLKPLTFLKPNQCNYEVQDVNTGELFKVKCTTIYRSKRSFTREKNKLYLKQAMNLVGESWTVKEQFYKKYDLGSCSFPDFFVGLPPQFKRTPLKRQKEKTETQRSVNGLTPDADGNKKKVPKLTDEEKEKKKEENKQKMAEIRQLKKEEKLKEREKKMEEKRVTAQYLQEWNRPRDDLLCVDLRDLPAPKNINCDLPQEAIGEVLMTLQFLHIFNEVLEMNDHFPNGLDFVTFQKGLLNNDVDSPLKDIFQFLLETLFALQDDNVQNVQFDDQQPEFVTLKDCEADEVKSKAVQQAAIAAKWPFRYHGTTLKNMSLDAFTMTEVLRLHLLSSGSRRVENVMPSEEPGVMFRIENEQLMDDLCVKNIFQLSIGDKLKLITVLVNQIIFHDVIRDYIEDALASLRQTKNELKLKKMSEGQRERDFAAKFKKFSDARALEKFYKSNEDGNEEAKSATDKPSSDPTAESNAVNEEVDEELEKVKKMTDRQWNEYSEKLIQDEAKKKETFLKEERVLMDSLVKNQQMGYVSPLGRDRAFRRYWLFTCIPGLFVEDDDLQFMGKCLPSPTPYIPEYQSHGQFEVPHTTLASKRKYLESKNDENSVSSDKENENSSSADDKTAVKKVMKASGEMGLSEKNGDHKEAPTINGSEIDKETDVKMADVTDDVLKMAPVADKTPVFGMCTTNEETCPVHSAKIERTRWSVFTSVDDIEKLISSLNTRGHREKDLLDSLKTDKWRLYDHISACPSDVLPLFEKTDAKDSDSDSIVKIFEINARDSILDLEEKIFHGTLGRLKVNDRTAWRTSIENGTLDLQCDSVEWCGSSLSDIKQYCQSLDITQPHIIAVKQLACAVLQLAQGLEPKYLKPPLGEDSDLKKMKMAEVLMRKLEKKSDTKADSENGTVVDNDSAMSSPMLKRSALERWSDSLMSCMGLSQLFLHIATFERSVEWSRSILNAKCKICRRKSDAENMLLCDNCDRGHHLYCLKPKLTVIPKGIWFCPSCRPKQTPKRRKPGRRVREVEEDEVNDELDESTAMTDANNTLPETEDSDMEEGEMEVQEEPDEDEESGTHCDSCGQTGDFISCKNCSLNFHWHCVTPKLKKPPRGNWVCNSCTPKPKDKEPGRRGKRAKIAIAARRGGKRGARARNSPKSMDDYDVATSSPDEDLRPARRSVSGRRSQEAGLNLNFKLCNDFLNELIKHEDSWLFLRPVTKKDAKDYHLYIKKPMDFGTMRGKLNNVLYKDNKEFLADAKLVFANCELYNPDESVEFQTGKRLRKYFETRAKELGLSSRKREVTQDEPTPKRRR